MLIAVISTLGSIIVAYITATANKKDGKEEASELNKLRKENTKLRSKLDNKRRGQK